MEYNLLALSMGVLFRLYVHGSLMVDGGYGEWCFLFQLMNEIAHDC